jgi:hypothetical protein
VEMEKPSEKEKMMTQKGKHKKKEGNKEQKIQKKLRTIAKKKKKERKEAKVRYRKIAIEGVQWRWKWGKRETSGFSVGGGICDGENGDNRNGKMIKKKVDGQRKWLPENKHKRVHKRKDTKGRGQAKKITKTANVRVYSVSEFDAGKS